MTEIQLVGREENTQKLQRHLEEQIEKLSVLTLQVTLADGKFLKESIYTLKTQIDPAELRIKRNTNHTEMKDLNHPFYFIPNYSKDVLIIGFEDEIQKAEEVLNDFLTKRSNSKRIFTLSHLLPLNLLDQIKRIRCEILSHFPQLQMFVYEPNPPRKHITLLLLGSWNDITIIKEVLRRRN